jgi:hypothetical protein
MSTTPNPHGKRSPTLRLQITVARCFVYGLLGADWSAGSYTDAGKQVHHLAMYGIRYVVDDFRQNVTTTRKDGSQGKLRIDYGKPSDSTVGEAAVKWLWKFVDGAKTAGELFRGSEASTGVSVVGV